LLPLGHCQPIAGFKTTTNMGGADMNRPRAADDFATIRTRIEELRHRPRAADDFATIHARMEELRREREGTKPSEKDAQRDPPLRHGRSERLFPEEVSSGSGRARRSG
jgi:hypothetical protein